MNTKEPQQTSKEELQATANDPCRFNINMRTYEGSFQALSITLKYSLFYLSHCNNL